LEHWQKPEGLIPALPQSAQADRGPRPGPRVRGDRSRPQPGFSIPRISGLSTGIPTLALHSRRRSQLRSRRGRRPGGLVEGDALEVGEGGGGEGERDGLEGGDGWLIMVILRMTQARDRL
jgi:hypothetical protein